MLVTLVLLVSISSAILISILIDAVKKHPYFAEAIRTYQLVEIPETPRSKGDIRRLRKYRALYKSAKRRLTLLFITHISLFSLVYVLMIFTVSLVSRSSEVVNIPVSIPFLSYMAETGVYRTHIYIVALIGFALPLYLVSRSVRFEQPGPRA
ncbi:hypothetical protein [Desulfurococcus mucosus]|uniref:Uncharacterized protein n=1 Tax=Desulfurococcus mucosus (strain ATCC 35584 / DSM 2162 / JCM 9187 / O7/1) TaxID=765177 RepID=E8RAL6_DESM0|nr:hypothetical protein [Desulfurococcus mucosus]ADV65452.1 hypothetical protein Desmu_1155 [Desulfurococcus mucosus DSM 2162]